MKRWISFLLMLALAMLPMGALAAQGDANLGRDMNEKYSDSIQSGFVIGDTLYISGYSGMYSYRLGDEDLTPLEYERPETADSESLDVNVNCIFSDGENIYALLTTYNIREGYSLERVELCELTMDGEKVNFGERREVDSSELITDYGDGNIYLVQINTVWCTGGRAFMRVYDDMGEEKIYVLDLESGEGAYIEDLENPGTCAVWKDGQLLIETYDYSGQSCEFLIYDPESESLTPACDPINADYCYQGMVYSEESGQLFYLSDGYVMAVRDFDFEGAEPVAEMSLAYYGDGAALLLPGDYYVMCNYEGVCVRSTDPDAMPETRLTIANSGYNQSVIDAYYDFGNTHGDVAVVMSQDYQDDSAIIESMMNRDATSDIYLLSVSSKAYSALFERGYMAELNSDAIRTAVEGMYPGIRKALERDGEIVALPVRLYGWCTGVSIDGFEKIGISREEIPTSWPEFLDLLAELPDRLPEDGSVRVFPEYYTQNTARENLVGVVLLSYRSYLAARGGDPSYDTPELRAILEQVNALDYEALGLKEEEDDDDMYQVYSVTLGVADSERTYTLVEFSTGCTLGNFYREFEPQLLSIVPGEAPQLSVEMMVAFVNPFSEHVELAQEFLATMLDDMETDLQYNLSDALNEPIRYSGYEEALESMQKELDAAREALEKAEPVDKPVYEDTVAQYERAMEEMEDYSWEISAESLEWYRASAENITVQQYDFLEDAEGLSDTAEQFLTGKIDVAAFLKGIDQKVRMMAMEGN